MTISIGDKIPDLTVATTKNEALSLTELNGKNIVIYFYPKDNTPGCTTEGIDFSAAYPEFQKHNTEIFGVSRESIKSHQNFINKHEFPFDLISDPDETLCNAFGVIQEKMNYGKKYMGIVRSTFIFDAKCMLQHEMRKVRVKEHVSAVLELVKEL